MNTLLKHNNEVQDNLMKLWDEKKEKLGLGEYSDEIALHIENQNTELLKKIAKGEIRRLNKKKNLLNIKLDEFKTNRTGAKSIFYTGEYIQIQEELTHWQQVLEDLEK